MNEHFDAIVIGSGFGGAVMTYRLAEAGMRVCLFERGRAYPPNSFPRTPYDLAKNFWDPSKGLFGLYNIWSFKGSGAVVSSGLGGGSLIYANVLIRKDEKWFKEDLAGGGYKLWPIQYKDLDNHYKNVEQMMNVQKYPLGCPPFNTISKTPVFREAAETVNRQGMACEWLPLNLAVSFRTKTVASPDENSSQNPPLVGAQIIEDYPNIHSKRAGYEMPRSTCRMCGECDLGCNYGSKNTLDFNYISAAVNQQKPADVRTLSEVKSFAPRTDGQKGYEVTYRVHRPEKFTGAKNGEAPAETVTVTCDYLILAAGTFGSPFLLLKNQAAFPGLSPMLGRRYSVNGDLLTFLVKSIEHKNGQTVPRRLDPSFGPVITSAIRFGDDLDDEGKKGRGFYVEDGGNPYLLSWFSELSGFAGTLRRSMKFLKIILKYRIGLRNDADLGAEIADLIGRAESSMSSIPVLAMGRDIADGRLFLKDGFLECDWQIRASEDYYRRVREAGRAIAKAMGAEFMDNPSYKWNFHQIMTAHPLGGCAVGENAESGVVNEFGEVFGYPGLYVADGSVMPGPVGPNPSLTIAAFADRFAENIISNFK